MRLSRAISSGRSSGSRGGGRMRSRPNEAAVRPQPGLPARRGGDNRRPLRPAFALSCRGSARTAEVFGGLHDAHALNALAEEAAEVAQVAGEQVGGASRDRRSEDRAVLGNQFDLKLTLGRLADHGHAPEERVEALALFPVVEVSQRFLHGVGRGQEPHAWTAPQLAQLRRGTVRGGEQHVGVEEDAVHRLRLPRAVVRDALRIKAKLADLSHSPAVVLLVHGGIEQELGLALAGVDLDGKQGRGADEKPPLGSFADDGVALTDPEALAQARRDDHRSALADLAGFELHRLPVRMPECLTLGHSDTMTPRPALINTLESILELSRR